MFENQLLIGVLVFVFTTFMAIGGVGAAFIDIPIFIYFGYDILFATALALLLNFFSTGTASLRHHKNRAIHYDIALPIIIASIITSPIGAIASTLVNKTDLKLIFALVLLLIGINIIYKTFKSSKNGTSGNEVKNNEELLIDRSKRLCLSVILGLAVGFISGLLGIGGGAIILPLLLYFGLHPKHAAGTTSFIVVFSSGISFLSKLTLTSFVIDYTLLIVTILVTIFGAVLGSYLMHFKLNKNQIRYIIAFFIELVAIKMIIDYLLLVLS
jgi:uncharacterized membrane protein YfcA